MIRWRFVGEVALLRLHSRAGGACKGFIGDQEAARQVHWYAVVRVHASIRSLCASVKGTSAWPSRVSSRLSAAAKTMSGIVTGFSTRAPASTDEPFLWRRREAATGITGPGQIRFESDSA